MKKILYSWVTKLIAMVCVLTAACICLTEVIDVISWEREKNEGYEEAYDDVVDYGDIYEDIYVEMGMNIDVLIAKYKEGGIQALADYYYRETGLQSKMLLYAVDSKYLYKYGLEPTETALGDYTVVKTGLMEGYEWADYQYMYISDNIYVKEYYRNGQSYATYSLYKYLSDETVEYLKSIDFELNISVRATLDYYCEKISERVDTFEEYTDGKYDRTIEEEIYDRIPVFIVCGIVVLMATAILIMICGRTPEDKKELNYYEKGYTELHLALILAIGAAVATGVYLLCQCYWDMDWDIQYRYKLALLYSVTGALLVGVFWFYYEAGIIIKKLINKRFIKDWLIVRVFLKIKKFIGKRCKGFLLYLKSIYNKKAYTTDSKVNSSYKLKVITDILAVFVIFILLCMLLEFDYEVAECILPILILLLVIYIIKTVREYIILYRYKRIKGAIDVLAEGNYKRTEIDENEKDITLRRIASMSGSFEEAVRKQVEAEKKQIELVANVSHDLKTPLTSIISYVDLLKEEEMSDAAKDYVTALVDKSSKLKDIVSDVFDLAKATSGERVELEQLDGVVLINQVLSDMSDMIAESGYDFRVKMTVETAPVIGNGQKLYRVFQNIIDNALKYSLKGTRIYLSAESDGNEFIVILKNVASKEMEFTEADILTRAQISEVVEDNDSKGLGVAIASSFTQQCKGSFDIRIDDDIFKVIIRFKLVCIENRGGVELYEENNIQ